MIIGIAENKDSSLILNKIIPLADNVFITRFQIKDRKCAHPKELLFKSKKYLKTGAKIEMFLDPESAVSKALSLATENDLVLVTGSFFLAGEIRKRWISEEKVLRERKLF